MSTQFIAIEAFQTIDELRVEPDRGTVESLNATRGFLLGIALCAPFWAGVYLLVRSIWN